jgi:hypothetical protein
MGFSWFPVAWADLNMDNQTSSLQFSAADYNVNEENGSAIITVTRSGDSQGAVSVDYATSDDSADNSDYIPTSGTLNWGDGDDADKTFTVELIKDSVLENDETLIVSLDNATGGAVLGSPDTAVLTITNHYSTSASTVVLSVEPPESNVSIGQEFEVNILVKAGSQQVDGASAYLDFDPTYLEVVNMTPGDQLNLTLDNSFDNAAGSINFAAGRLTAPFPSRDFELVTISLKAKAATSKTTLQFLYNPPKRTDATFGGASVFDHAEDGSIIITGFNCKKVTEIPKKECLAIVELYDSTKGKNWKDSTGWKATNSPCSWYGVTCWKKHVTELSLEDNNLNGAISKKFFKLKNLKVLVLSDNDLNGSSLKDFKKLKNLETLLVNNCNLSGKIPNSLMKLKNLTELDLNYNCLKTKVSKKLGKWLDEINPGWDETQTACFE